MQQVRKRSLQVIVLIIVFIIPSNPLLISAQNAPETLQPVSTLGKHGRIMDLAWSPDGLTLAVSTYLGIILYDKQLNEIDFLEPTGDIKAAGNIMWSPEGNRLFSSNTNEAYIRDAASGYILHTRQMDENDHEAYIWDTASGEILHTLQLDENDYVLPHVWNAGDDVILVTLQTDSIQQALLLWNAQTGDIQEISISELELSTDAIWSWSDDQERLETTSGSESFTISLVDNASIERTSISSAGNTNISMSPDEHNQAIMGESVEVTNPHGFYFEIIDHDDNQFTRFDHINWAENSNRIAVWGEQTLPNLVVADVSTGEVLLEFTYDQKGVVWLARLNSDGSSIALATFRQELMVYDFKEDVWHQRWLNGYSARLSFSPDGSRIATVAGDTQYIYIWNPLTGEEIEVWQIPDEPDQGDIFSVVWSPDSTYVATGSQRSGTDRDTRPIDLFIWSAESGQVVQKVPAVAYLGDVITELEWSADSQIIAYSTASNQTGNSHIGVYNVQKEELYFQRLVGGHVLDMTLHPNDEIMVATVSYNREDPENMRPILVDTRTGDVLDIQTPDIESPITAMDWHPSGNYLALRTAESSQIEIWTWESNDNLSLHMSFTMHDWESPNSLKWSSDGNHLAAHYREEGNSDLGVQVWDLDLVDGTAQLSHRLIDSDPDYFAPVGSVQALNWSINDHYIAATLSQFTTSIWKIK